MHIDCIINSRDFLNNCNKESVYIYIPYIQKSAIVYIYTWTPVCILFNFFPRKEPFTVSKTEFSYQIISVLSVKFISHWLYK